MGAGTRIWFRDDLIAALQAVKFASPKYHPDYKLAIQLMEIALGVNLGQQTVTYELPREGWIKTIGG